MRRRGHPLLLGNSPPVWTRFAEKSEEPGCRERRHHGPGLHPHAFSGPIDGELHAGEQDVGPDVQR